MRVRVFIIGPHCGNVTVPQPPSTIAPQSFAFGRRLCVNVAGSQNLRENARSFFKEFTMVYPPDTLDRRVEAPWIYRPWGRGPLILQKTSTEKLLTKSTQSINMRWKIISFKAFGIQLSLVIGRAIVQTLHWRVTFAPISPRHSQALNRDAKIKRNHVYTSDCISSMNSENFRFREVRSPDEPFSLIRENRYWVVALRAEVLSLLLNA